MRWLRWSRVHIEWQLSITRFENTFAIVFYLILTPPANHRLRSFTPQYRGIYVATWDVIYLPNHGRWCVRIKHAIFPNFYNSLADRAAIVSECWRDDGVLFQLSLPLLLLRLSPVFRREIMMRKRGDTRVKKGHGRGRRSIRSMWHVFFDEQASHTIRCLTDAQQT